MITISKEQKIKVLHQQINDIQFKLRNAGNSKPQFMIDDDDEYQDQLELLEYKNDLRTELAACIAELDSL